MKRGLIGAAILLVSGLLYWRLVHIPSPAKEEFTVPTGKSITQAEGSPTLSPALITSGAPSITATPVLQGDEAITFLTDAVATFDAAQLPFLARYLAHPDPEIRASARDAIVQLGEPGGVELLKAAAAQTKDLEEAAELRKAADLLALPSWTEQRRMKRSRN